MVTGAHRRIHSDRNLQNHRNLRNGNGHEHIQTDQKKPTIVRSNNQTNGNHPARSTVTLVPPDASPVLRDKSRMARPVPGKRRTRGHKSLGDLQDLIMYKVRDTVTNKKQMTRKSDGKEYRVRREYVF